MSHIYPIEGQKHFDLHAELSDLGGKDKQTFRLAFAWDGEHFMEVTDDDAGVDLYLKWIELHGGTRGTDSPGSDADADDHAGAGGAPIVAVDDEDAAERAQAEVVALAATQDRQADRNNEDIPENRTTDGQTETLMQSADVGAQDGANTDEENTDNASAEPPGDKSADESPAATDAPDLDTAESTEDLKESESKAGSSTSGTPRKRSAKNSTRRS